VHTNRLPNKKFILICVGRIGPFLVALCQSATLQGNIFIIRIVSLESLSKMFKISRYSDLPKPSYRLRVESMPDCQCETIRKHSLRFNKMTSKCQLKYRSTLSNFVLFQIVLIQYWQHLEPTRWQLRKHLCKYLHPNWLIKCSLLCPNLKGQHMQFDYCSMSSFWQCVK